MSRPSISGLPTVHWLEHPEFYNADDVVPAFVSPVLSGADRAQISKCIFLIESIIENSFTGSGSSNLGEFLRPMQSSAMQLNYVLKGREVPGLFEVKRSGGWTLRRMSENKIKEINHV
jgi:hypothetical protein